MSPRRPSIWKREAGVLQTPVSGVPGAAVAVLRGAVLGLFAFATFLLVLASLLGRIDTAAAFVCATVAALLVQALSYIHGTREEREHFNRALA